MTEAAFAVLLGLLFAVGTYLALRRDVVREIGRASCRERVYCEV